MFAFFFKRNHTFDTEKRGCVKTLAQPLLYFTVLLYFLLAMLDQRKNMGHRTKRFFQWSEKMGERF